MGIHRVNFGRRGQVPLAEGENRGRWPTVRCQNTQQEKRTSELLPPRSGIGPTLTFPIPGRRSGEPGKADLLSGQRNEVPRRDRLRAGARMLSSLVECDARRCSQALCPGGAGRPRCTPRFRRSIHSIAHSFTSRRRPSLRVFAQSKLSVPTMRRSGVPGSVVDPTMTLLVHIEN